ncbi:MAG: response regulator, partial [Bryobacteraceae bacterium]
MTARILNVDDRATNRYVRSEILRHAGYSIVECRTGREALEKSLGENPDLVLLDVHLPDFSGLEVCRLLKNDQRTAGIMVLHISGSAVDIEDAVLGLDVGADDYLIEPVEASLLVAKVRALLRLRAAEEKLRLSNQRLAAFAAAASHDLRGPLRGVAMFSELLRGDYRDQLDARGKEYIDFIVTGARRMDQMISDLLDYSQLTADPHQEHEIVSMGLVLENVILVNKSRLDALQARVTSDALPEIRGNRITLNRIIHNLIDNALKYSRPGANPEIHVSAT